MDKKIKKLTLNRETVRNLSDNDLKTLAGGVETDLCSRTRRCSDCCSATAICSGCCM